MLLSERIAADEITVTYAMTGQTKTHYQWAVVLHRPDGRSFMLPDPWEDNDEPTALSVMSLITGSLNIVDQSADWREWASEYVGSDPEEQEKHFSADKFETWVGINNGMREFLGYQGHEDYLYDTDRDD